MHFLFHIFYYNLLWQAFLEGTTKVPKKVDLRHTLVTDLVSHLFEIKQKKTKHCIKNILTPRSCRMNVFRKACKKMVNSLRQITTSKKIRNIWIKYYSSRLRSVYTNHYFQSMHPNELFLKIGGCSTLPSGAEEIVILKTIEIFWRFWLDLQNLHVNV